MNRKQYIQSTGIRFRRWSRKGYAAFISLRRAVTIGNLSANVSERFQTKNGAIHASVLFNRNSNPEIQEEEEELSAEQRFGMTAWFQLPALFPLFIVKTADACVHTHLIDNNISQRAEGSGIIAGAFRSFVLYK